MSCGPGDWPEGCAEKRIGYTGCESDSISGERVGPGTWVVRSRAEYDALNEECQFSTTWGHTPPVPGREDMLLVVRVYASGCAQCLMPVCISDAGDRIVAEFTSAQRGGCLPQIIFTYWILVPDSDKPVEFTGIDCPEIPEDEPLPCVDHPLFPSYGP
jgi:hypothetical protein